MIAIENNPKTAAGLLTHKEAAKLLRIDARTLASLGDAGQISFIRVRNLRRYDWQTLLGELLYRPAAAAAPVAPPNPTPEAAAEHAAEIVGDLQPAGQAQSEAMR